MMYDVHRAMRYYDIELVAAEERLEWFRRRMYA
jgi:hypothetical protein